MSEVGQLKVLAFELSTAMLHAAISNVDPSDYARITERQHWLIMEAFKKVRALPAEEVTTDAKRLDWLAQQGVRGLRWVARKSITGRGYRLHQSSMIGEAMGETPRQAIDYAMRDGMNNGE